MKKLLFLLWLSSAAFSASIYASPWIAAEGTNSVAGGMLAYNGETSWFSLWADNMSASKSISREPVSQIAAITPVVANIEPASQIAASLPAAALPSIGTWSGLASNEALTASDASAAIADNPEPGTWGLLLLGVVPGLFALRRRRTG